MKTGVEEKAREAAQSNGSFQDFFFLGIRPAFMQSHVFVTELLNLAPRIDVITTSRRHHWPSNPWRSDTTATKSHNHRHTATRWQVIIGVPPARETGSFARKPGGRRRSYSLKSRCIPGSRRPVLGLHGCGWGEAVA